MTIQQLTYFLATAEHGSFSAAARSLYLTQPSISEQVRQLEAELGIALFARAGRGLVLMRQADASAPRPSACSPTSSGRGTQSRRYATCGEER